jgi:hypothetical protein
VQAATAHPRTWRVTASDACTACWYLLAAAERCTNNMVLKTPSSCCMRPLLDNHVVHHSEAVCEVTYIRSTSAQQVRCCAWQVHNTSPASTKHGSKGLVCYWHPTLSKDTCALGACGHTRWWSGLKTKAPPMLCCAPIGLHLSAFCCLLKLLSSHQLLADHASPTGIDHCLHVGAGLAPAWVIHIAARTHCLHCSPQSTAAVCSMTALIG